MQILSEANRPYIIDSLTAPMGVSHFWSFSGHALDFKLEQTQYLEEIAGQTIKIRVQNLEIELPASWYVMVVDRETYTIDMVPLPHCASFDHDVFLFSPEDGKLKTGKITVLDFLKSGVCIAPEIPKGSAMVHPIGIDSIHGRQVYYGIVVGSYDLHRWIDGKTVGDIL